MKAGCFTPELMRLPEPTAPSVPLRSAPAGRDARAFSLVEIMVAVSLLLVITVALLLMFNATQRVFRSGVGQTDVLEGGRSAISMLTRDLQEAVVSGQDGQPNLLVQNYYSAPPTFPVIRDKEGSLLHTYFFLTRQNDSWRAVGYFADNVPIATLHRFEKTIYYTNSVQELVADFSGAVADYADFLRGISPALNRGTNLHRMVDGVVHLKLTPYDIDGAPFPTLDLTKSYVFPTNGVALPAAFDLDLGLIEPTAAAQYKILADIPSPQANVYLNDQLGRVHLFRQRVSLRTAAANE